MVLSNLELYEALKPRVGEEAAKMIAEVLPVGRDIATKQDIARLEARMDGFEAALARLETRILRLMLTFFVPMWVTILAALVAVVVKA